MARPDLRTFLERSLTVLAREAPESYRRLCGALTGRRIRVDDGERPFALRFDAGAVLCADADGQESIFAGIDRPTVLSLIDGAITLEGALRSDRLVVRAGVTDVAVAFEGLLVYVRGALRCPSFPDLLSEFRILQTRSVDDERRAQTSSRHIIRPPVVR